MYKVVIIINQDLYATMLLRVVIVNQDFYANVILAKSNINNKSGL